MSVKVFNSLLKEPVAVLKALVKFVKYPLPSMDAGSNWIAEGEIHIGSYWVLVSQCPPTGRERLIPVGQIEYIEIIPAPLNDEGAASGS